jgi:hypothetical protein
LDERKKYAHDYVYEGVDYFDKQHVHMTMYVYMGLTICAQDFVYKGVDYLGCTICAQDHRSRGWLYGMYNMCRKLWMKPLIIWYSQICAQLVASYL